MKKLILKLFHKWYYKPEPIDKAKMDDWLYASYNNDGFKNYYTMRKRYLFNLIVEEEDPIKRARLKGRLDELRGLSANISEEYKRRKDKK